MISKDGTLPPASHPEPGQHGASKSADATLDRAIQDRIGDRLRAMYDNLADQPLPDRLSAILSRLDGKGGERV
jgi:hypothetical protein